MEIAVHFCAELAGTDAAGACRGPYRPMDRALIMFSPPLLFFFFVLEVPGRSNETCGNAMFILGSR